MWSTRTPRQLRVWIIHSYAHNFPGVNDRRQESYLIKWKEFREPYGEDVLNIFKEYSSTMNMDQFQRTPGKPDDTFHAILYCLLASMITHPRPDIIVPMEYDMVGG